MKLFFLENDSFYKIYKTLEKLAQNKKATCFVEHTNPLFENIRQGKQLKNLIKEKKLDITRIAKTEKTKTFFHESGLIYEYKYKNKRQRNLNLTYLFFFKNNTFHQSWINKAEYVRHIIRGAEIFAIGVILYVIYLLVWPSAHITIEPTYALQDIVYNFRYYPRQTDIFNLEQERLSIPYQTGSITHTITMKQSVENLSNAQQRASGSITLYNTTNIPYDIIANSTFITDAGLLFKSPKKFTIPAKISDQTPGQITLELIANDTDITGNIIGEKGNIPEGTTLYIKNLHNSYFLKNIYAKTNQDFQGGKTLSSGTVTQSDIDKLHQKILAQSTEQMKDIIRQEFDIPDTVLLYFDTLFAAHPQSFSAKQKAGDGSSIVEGSLQVVYDFPYVMQSDIIRQFEQYMRERSSNVEKLVDIKIQSLTLYDIKVTGEGDTAGQLIIPTQVTTIQTYNFEKDPDSILPTIKNNILGKHRDNISSVTKPYKQINTIHTKINPFWLNQVPTTKSRVFFIIK